jgi:hypothetical protein
MPARPTSRSGGGFASPRRRGRVITYVIWAVSLLVAVSMAVPFCGLPSAP